jgi:hypothetical protein
LINNTILKDIPAQREALKEEYNEKYDGDGGIKINNALCVIRRHGPNRAPFVSHCTPPSKPPQSKLKTVTDILNFTEFSAKN